MLKSCLPIAKKCGWDLAFDGMEDSCWTWRLTWNTSHIHKMTLRVDKSAWLTINIVAEKRDSVFARYFNCRPQIVETKLYKSNSGSSRTAPLDQLNWREKDDPLCADFEKVLRTVWRPSWSHKLQVSWILVEINVGRAREISLSRGLYSACLKAGSQRLEKKEAVTRPCNRCGLWTRLQWNFLARQES